MGVNIVQSRSSFDLRLCDYRPEIEYQVASSPEFRNEIFKFRYNAYRREGVIRENPTGIFTDYYDTLENCWIFGILSNGELVSSIRVHVISPEFRRGPALDVFPDIVTPMLDAGDVLVDPTRFVTSHNAILRIPELVYVTLRVPSMASLAFNARYCLVTVREEHIRFYKRVLNATQLCEPRPYPELMYHICAMRVDIAQMRDELAKRHSAFQTPLSDWRHMFERPGPVVPPNLEAPPLAPLIN